MTLHENVQPGSPEFGNEFGYDVSIFDDLIAIGAPGEDDLIRQDCGAVYLYRLEENNLEKVIKSYLQLGMMVTVLVTL